jgi:hypothetical protein
MRIMLVWTDAPGRDWAEARGVGNSLDLVVEGGIHYRQRLRGERLVHDRGAADSR